jgi:hypothetical protein
VPTLALYNQNADLGPFVRNCRPVLAQQNTNCVNPTSDRGVEFYAQGGVVVDGTPCVDRARGWSFYQCNGKLLRISATDGEVLRSSNVGTPNVCISWNTVLVDDVVREETASILASPGMGWETFHRAAAQDKNLPSRVADRTKRIFILNVPMKLGSIVLLPHQSHFAWGEFFDGEIIGHAT